MICVCFTPDVRLGTRDEEGPGLVQHIKAGKVDVATIHDVDGSGFRQEHIEGMNVVQLAIRDVDKTRNVAPQVEQRVHLHRRLGGAEVRPRKDRQAQSDGRRVQGVDGIGQVQPQFFVESGPLSAQVIKSAYDPKRTFKCQSGDEQF